MHCLRDSWADPSPARFSSPIPGLPTCWWRKPIAADACCWSAMRRTNTSPRAVRHEYRHRRYMRSCWKLAALVQGFGGPGLLDSYDAERRPVGLRNRQASGRHTEVRLAIAEAYREAGRSFEEPSAEADACRTALAARIAALGNAENESYGIELGYAYLRSPIVCGETDAENPDDPIRYVPTTAPGARLPSVLLADGSALFDRLGPWFTLIAFGTAPDPELVTAAKRLGMPLEA